MIKAVIFDFNRTLFDPYNQKLYPGALNLVRDLKGKFKLGLVTTSGKGRDKSISESGLRYLFDFVRIVRVKDESVFDEFLKMYDYKPSELVIIGDWLGDEIAAGNNIGATTIWINKWAVTDMWVNNKNEQPDFVAVSYEDIKNILKVK